jgi:hypothetical protein
MSVFIAGNMNVGVTGESARRSEVWSVFFCFENSKGKVGEENTAAYGEVITDSLGEFR